MSKRDRKINKNVQGVKEESEVGVESGLAVLQNIVLDPFLERSRGEDQDQRPVEIFLSIKQQKIGQPNAHVGTDPSQHNVRP